MTMMTRMTPMVTTIMTTRHDDDDKDDDDDDDYDVDRDEDNNIVLDRV